MRAWEQEFAELFAPRFIDYASADVQFSLEAPPPELVSRIHLVARTGEGSVIVCVNDLGWRFLPGGTREPGEELAAGLDREIREEAGARRIGPWSVVGAFRAQIRAPEPYRPHMPHPVAYWAYAVADVLLDGLPTNPPDGEQVTEVLVLPPADAADFLAVHDPIHADVVRLTAAMGLI
ncbi:hypothetical protein GCM10009841_21510 [Microlunatus panaciterrae]|uniref:8-oxo-dGTP diphosphatase n=1 Tax=Microlunatus panaciterrae TaxID=400768 RepID=A0ABS2RRY9_9ACTN|nr:NUDIX domain-containing protein [Microlunatus panaciterrae]MBM7800704.1 8-oxo-dGTP diphosphatase [Microlunatus panaciterrae]